MAPDSLRTVTSLTALPITVCRNVLISCCHQYRICVIDYLRLIIFLRVIAPRPVMCCFMLICQCCFAIVKVLLKKVTYLLTLPCTDDLGSDLCGSCGEQGHIEPSLLVSRDRNNKE